MASFTHTTTGLLLGRALTALGHLLAAATIVCGGAAAVALASCV